MAATGRPSSLTLVLAASNVLLLAHALRGPAKQLLNWLKWQLYHRIRPGTAAQYPITDDLLGKDYEPPLPKPIAEALQRSCLCFLATTTKYEPHLSLMRFTYWTSLTETDSEVMIISTQRNTKKFDILTENKNVALLVHDFATHTDQENLDYMPTGGGQPRYSITLNGSVRVEEGEVAEHYRSVHLSRNQAYSQFIVGDNVAIITVHLKRARICDVNDRVQHFQRVDGQKSWTEIAK